MSEDVVRSDPSDLEEPMEELIRRLLASPLWHMSRGSKELFHSDTLAWLADRFQVEMRDTLSPWLDKAQGAAASATLREWRHLDLVFRFRDRAPLVVENKAFAVPDEGQLERYGGRVIPALRGSATTVFLSLMDPGWGEDGFTAGGHTWSWLSYGELSSRLLDSFPPRPDAFEGEMALRYAALIRLLQEIVDEVDIRDPSEPLLPAPESSLLLRQARLEELAAKVRVQRLKVWLIRELADAGVEGVMLAAGFTNGTPLLEVFARSAGGDDFGWQYQRGQWRLALRVREEHQGRDDRARYHRETFARAHMGWFDFAPFVELTDVREGSPPRSNETKTGGFNRFDPDFIYRYRPLPSASARELLDLAIVYSARAVEFAAAEV